MGKHAIRKARLRIVKETDARLNGNKPKQEHETHLAVPEVTKADEFFAFNKCLGPPYHVIVDTSFLNMIVKTKQDMINAMIQCLSAKVTVYVTDCVMTELEKHHDEFYIAIRLAKDPRVKRLKCQHKQLGYGDDCLVQRAIESKIYIIAANDRELRQRIRKIPGTPIMYAKQGTVAIERLDNDVI